MQVEKILVRFQSGAADTVGIDRGKSMTIFVITARMLMGHGRYNVDVTTNMQQALTSAWQSQQEGCIDVKIEVWCNGESYILEF